MKLTIRITRHNSTDDASLYVATCLVPKWSPFIGARFYSSPNRVPDNAVGDVAAIVLTYISDRIKANPELLPMIMPIDLEVDPKVHGRGA